MRKHHIALSLAAIITLSLSAVAQDKEKKDVGPDKKAPAGEGKGKGKGGGMERPDFKELDTNGDEKISRVEFGKSPMAEKIREKGGKEALDRIFKMRDKNEDGSIGIAEYNAEIGGGKGKSKGKGKGKGKGGPGGKGNPGKGAK